MARYQIRVTRGENEAASRVFANGKYAYVKLDTRKYVILSEKLQTEVKQNHRASWIMYISESTVKRKEIFKFVILIIWSYNLLLHII